MKCRKCGVEISEGVNFCANCGAAIADSNIDSIRDYDLNSDTKTENEHMQISEKMKNLCNPIILAENKGKFDGTYQNMSDKAKGVVGNITSDENKGKAKAKEAYRRAVKEFKEFNYYDKAIFVALVTEFCFVLSFYA